MRKGSLLFSKSTKRALAVCAALTVSFIGSAGPAQAANAYLLLDDRDGRQLGAMTHYDAETDTFKVCDTQREGRSVTGTLWRSGSPKNVLLLTITDDDDAGCNSKRYNIRSGYAYYLQLSYNGSTQIFKNIRIWE
ncbi:hypothetical protein [Kribbella sp. CA-293567]|uniref:hypothetical protein n=1 Tax=Kribbella sp. CA-293567 TaxID=3002436 RepID=UPI0022DE41F4|nr:hypothetical protein [Kribbella sp. CA-293567]WBQ05252.1 hypothetical protein OX958_00285 [Kribbella sp. CA-293567]